MKKRIKGICLTDFIIGFIILAILLVVICAIIFAVKNDANKINEGVVVDKHYRSEYVSYTYSGSGDNKISIPYIVPESYTLTIQGEKNGEPVEYYFNVPEQEYFKYNIGDYYKK